MQTKTLSRRVRYPEGLWDVFYLHLETWHRSISPQPLAVSFYIPLQSRWGQKCLLSGTLCTKVSSNVPGHREVWSKGETNNLWVQLPSYPLFKLDIWFCFLQTSMKTLLSTILDNFINITLDYKLFLYLSNPSILNLQNVPHHNFTENPWHKMLSSFKLICAYKPDESPQRYINSPTRNHKLPNYSVIEIENFVALRPHTKLAAVALTSSPHLLSKMVMFGSMVAVVIKCDFTATLIHYVLNI